MKREKNDRLDDPLDTLKDLALELGAHAAAIISADEIPVDDRIPEMCRRPRCEGYDKSARCPPHVAGPSWLRERLKENRYALVFRIDFPREVLLSHGRIDAFRMLHYLAAEIERSAVRAGFANSLAFAGNSCNLLFCQDHPRCRVLSGEGECRNPDLARPSMSGFGVEVNRLKQAAGLQPLPAAGEADSPSVDSLVGLVLIG